MSLSEEAEPSDPRRSKQGQGSVIRYFTEEKRRMRQKQLQRQDERDFSVPREDEFEEEKRISEREEGLPLSSFHPLRTD